MPGVLITGGSEFPTAVELFLPDSGDVCLMPQIQGIRDVSRDVGRQWSRTVIMNY